MILCQKNQGTITSYLSRRAPVNLQSLPNISNKAIKLAYSTALSIASTNSAKMSKSKPYKYKQLKNIKKWKNLQLIVNILGLKSSIKFHNQHHDIFVQFIHLNWQNEFEFNSMVFAIKKTKSANTAIV